MRDGDASRVRLLHPPEDLLLRGTWKNRDNLHHALSPSKEKPKAPRISLEGSPWQRLDELNLSGELSLGNPSNVFQDASGFFILKVIQGPLSRSGNARIARKLGEGLAEPINGFCWWGRGLFQSDGSRNLSG